LDRFRFPKAQEVTSIDAIAENWCVVSNASHFRLRNPLHAKATAFTGRFGLTAKFHAVGNVRARNFPRVSGAQPFVGDFALPAVTNDLIENSKLVADAVADGRNFN